MQPRDTVESEEGKATAAGMTQIGMMILMKEACHAKSSVEDRREEGVIEEVEEGAGREAGLEARAAGEAAEAAVEAEAGAAAGDLAEAVEGVETRDSFS
jgi:hypothetical protein